MNGVIIVCIVKEMNYGETKMIHKIYCPECDRTFILCMDHYDHNGRFHIDGNYCKHLIDTVKNLVMRNCYD